jgi:hypothetical protein
MKVDAHYAVGAGRAQQVYKQTGRDWFAARGFSVLPGVAEEGAHGRDAARRCPLGGIDHKELFEDGRMDHHVLGAMSLDDEDVIAAQGFVETYTYLAVGEITYTGVSQLYAKMLGYLLGQFRVCPSCQELEAMIISHAVHYSFSVARLQHLCNEDPVNKFDFSSVKP